MRKKQNFSYDNVLLNDIPIGHAITQAKKNDVDKLLRKMFGENWAVGEPLQDERLLWYKNIVFNTPTVEQEPVEEQCDCLAHERCDLHI